MIGMVKAEKQVGGRTYFNSTARLVLGKEKRSSLRTSHFGDNGTAYFVAFFKAFFTRATFRARRS